MKNEEIRTAEELLQQASGILRSLQTLICLQLDRDFNADGDLPAPSADNIYAALGGAARLVEEVEDMLVPSGKE